MFYLKEVINVLYSIDTAIFNIQKMRTPQFYFDIIRPTENEVGGSKLLPIWFNFLSPRVL